MSEPQRILLVDDDAEALEMLCEFLVDEGYVVETASDGRTALAKLETFAADLLVTDFEMPGMCGDELIQQVQARHPHHPALLVSAREDFSAASADGYDGGGTARLQKPVDLDELAMIVRRLIDEMRTTIPDRSAAAVR